MRGVGGARQDCGREGGRQHAPCWSGRLRGRTGTAAAISRTARGQDWTARLRAPSFDNLRLLRGEVVQELFDVGRNGNRHEPRLRVEVVLARFVDDQGQPSFGTASRLADVLGVSLDVLASGAEIPEPPPSFRNRALLKRMEELDELPAEKQELALRILEAVVAGELDGFVKRLRG
jgi:hypothetical protein